MEDFILSQILNIFPEYRQEYERVQAIDDGEGPPSLCYHFGELIYWYVDHVGQFTNETKQSFFSAIEEWFAWSETNDIELMTVIATCLIEGLDNVAMWGRIPRDEFLSYLGARSSRYVAHRMT